MSNPISEVTGGCFFFRRMQFTDDGVLTVVVGDGKEDHVEITFQYVRTFAFLKEIDFVQEFRRYEHVKLVHGGERYLGVYRITRGSILERVLDHRLDGESPMYFWVATPDECMEVVGFGEPIVKQHVKMHMPDRSN
jgi:hypothetical protein